MSAPSSTPTSTPPQLPQPATEMPGALGKAGRGLLAWLERARVRLEPLSRRVFGPLATPAELARGGHPGGGYEAEADTAIAAQATQRAQQIIRTTVVVLVGLTLWAAVAKVDEVTKGEAKVIPSRQLQVIQSLDGGVVSEILVKQGQLVEAGQLLLKIDETRATSGVRESAATAFSLQAKRARLQALANGTSFQPPGPSDPEEQHVIDGERQLYEARVAELGALVAIAQQQLAQRQQELGEIRARRDAAQRSLELSMQELGKTRPLLASGAVSEVDILRLERDVTKARGEVEQSGANIARVQAAIGESQRKIQETELSFRNEARKELSEVLAKINALAEGSVALADRVDKAQVKSPVRGRVQRLLANTVGGVLQPGRDIVEIVPLDDTLVLEARVAPKDIGFISPGQKAVVKFTAYDYAIFGGLDAKVEDISPDTTTDERGNAYYTVRVRTGKPALREDLPIIPGMTAEVDVLTGRKTVLSYLLQPVLKVQGGALRER